MENKKSFFLKLNPPRPSFMNDMNEEEKMVMQEHVAYWAPHVRSGIVLVLGPVMDPSGGYGMAVIRVNDEQEVFDLISNDPANGLNTYEVFPMLAVSKF